MSSWLENLSFPKFLNPCCNKLFCFFFSRAYTCCRLTYELFRPRHHRFHIPRPLNLFVRTRQFFFAQPLGQTLTLSIPPIFACSFHPCHPPIFCSTLLPSRSSGQTQIFFCWSQTLPPSSGYLDFFYREPRSSSS